MACYCVMEGSRIETPEYHVPPATILLDHEHSGKAVGLAPFLVLWRINPNRYDPLAIFSKFSFLFSFCFNIFFTFSIFLFFIFFSSVFVFFPCTLENQSQQV